MLIYAASMFLRLINNHHNIFLQKKLLSLGASARRELGASGNTSFVELQEHENTRLLAAKRFDMTCGATPYHNKTQHKMAGHIIGHDMT